MNIYDFKVLNNKGDEVSLSEYRGKIILIFNSATRCGFTPQYKDLEKLYEQFKEKGLVVIDFPCNQFANQAPESDSEIASFCSLKYKTTFPLFKKIEVNGDGASPLFNYLKKTAKSYKKSFKIKLLSLMSKTTKSNDIHWNFTKFLIDRNGEVLLRFEPDTPIDKIQEEIEKLL